MYFYFRSIAFFAYGISVACIVLFATLAYDYTFGTGFGLHPALAAIASALLMAYMYVVYKIDREEFFSEFEDDESTHLPTNS